MDVKIELNERLIELNGAQTEPDKRRQGIKRMQTKSTRTRSKSKDDQK